MRTHYHVMYGLVGCLPDSNDTYTNKRDAIHAYNETIADANYENGHHFPMRDSGIPRVAYCNDGNCIHVVELVDCNDTECQEDY